MNLRNSVCKPKPGDFVLFIAVLAAAVYCFAGMVKSGAAREAVIKQNGVELYRIDMGELKEPVFIRVDGVEICVSADGARFVHSDCPDGVCVRTGKITRAGQAAVCVPNRVVLVLEGGADADSDGMDVIT